MIDPTRRACLRAVTAAGIAPALPALLAGCAAPQTAALLHTPDLLAPSVRLDGVPFFPQRQYQCGPAALASVLAFAGRPVSPDDLVAQVYLPARHGSLQPEMAAAVLRQGLVPCPLAPRLQALLQELQAGLPVLVLQNLSLDFAPVWHYAVAIGYDLAGQTLLLHSGIDAQVAMSMHVFERTWLRADGWALVVAPAGQVSATTEPLRYLKAAAALERLSPAAASQAYQAATRRWPHQPLAWFALANAAMATGAWADAQASLQRALQLDPQLASAWNNLALVLFRRGEPQAARDAIDQALALAPANAAYRETATQIGSGR